ncbi:hypothetical protein F443_21682 [Phytophthora nicotianae P1569]|uniref:Uncharacterized protein n=1 Tax=Phytophthora nicotianae P1569 TaxID=1317065 RepID=V9DXC2_PHYNI|nr:hypothetical protein F443_21682 [Phytophthora nicotianae P1569]
MVQDTALKNENEKDEIQEQWEREWGSFFHLI